MKTPIQEFIDEINQEIDYAIQNESEDDMWHNVYRDVTIKVLAHIESILKQSYLEKEKEAMCDFANNYGFQECGCDYGKAEEYYHETFNTKEK